MFSIPLYLDGLAAAAALAALAWPLSIYLRNVAIVDSLWSLMFLLQAIVYAIGTAAGESDGAPARLGARAWLVLALVTMWALRLSFYITWRNRGHGEDRRYQAIRARNEPHFAFKSLYLVFLLQAGLAWMISLPLLAAIPGAGRLAMLDWAGCALWLLGMVFESGADWQLASFKSDPANRGRVMDRGLWAYTRHPNYFGEFCIWWAYFLFALAAGGWWSLPGPVLMCLLLMRVSGVVLLEKDIAERRPGYSDYVRRTNAFFPGFPRK
jgi:steroid 5-alpha reductase family enzyme